MPNPTIQLYPYIFQPSSGPPIAASTYTCRFCRSKLETPDTQDAVYLWLGRVEKFGAE